MSEVTMKLVTMIKEEDEDKTTYASRKPPRNMLSRSTLEDNWNECDNIDITRVLL